MVKTVPTNKIQLFRSCLVGAEYPGVETSTTYVFDRLGIDYVIDKRMSCCTGLGYYYDLFDQFSTTALTARNFWVARDTGYRNFAVLCSTCYAVMKKACNILNRNNETRNRINGIFDELGMRHMKYEKNSFNPEKNIFHAAEILYVKTKAISKLCKLDLSNIPVAGHHACHYYRVQYKDAIGDYQNPMLIETIAKGCGANVVDWYNDKTLTCGAGFRQRFTNKDLSLAVTADKLRSLKENNVDVLLHMCPNCHMQYDRYQPIIEKKTNVKFNISHLNIAQFVALAMGADPHKTVGIQTHTVPIESLVKKIRRGGRNK